MDNHGTHPHGTHHDDINVEWKAIGPLHFPVNRNRHNLGSHALAERGTDTTPHPLGKLEHLHARAAQEKTLCLTDRYAQNNKTEWDRPSAMAAPA